MDAQHANLSSSLPTRRSMRLSQSAPSPADVSTADDSSQVKTPEQPVLTRRQMREAELRAQSSVRVFEGENHQSAPQQPVPVLTRAQLREQRQLALAVPVLVDEAENADVHAELVSNGYTVEMVSEAEIAVDASVESVVLAETAVPDLDGELDVAAILARVQAQLPQNYLDADEPAIAAVDVVAEPTVYEANDVETTVVETTAVDTTAVDAAIVDAPVIDANAGAAHLASDFEPTDASEPSGSHSYAERLEAFAQIHAVNQEQLREPSVRIGAVARAHNAQALSHGHPAGSPAQSSARRNQWVPRLAVLGTLGLATIAFPTVSYLDNQAPIAQAAPQASVAEVGPSVVEIVNSSNISNDVPASIAQMVSEDARAYLVASRSEERVSLEGCEATGLVNGQNGKIDTSKLCQIAKGHYLQPDAANAYAELSDAFEARFGEKLCVVSSYRTVADQVRMKATRGSYAATPGLSNHGWGTAIDLCGGSYKSNAKWYWLNENAPSFGWEHPSWASRSYEAWHWEYAPGVDALAEY